MIILLQLPESITNITTNSSSEIFIINKHAKINHVNEVIDSNKWRGWMGETQQFKTVEEIHKMVGELGFESVIRTLFPELKDYPECPWSSHDLGRCSAAMRELYSRQPKNSGRSEAEQQAAHDWYLEKHALHKKEVEEYLKTVDLSHYVGQYWFSTGEDNELDGETWQDIHETIPGRYCRTS